MRRFAAGLFLVLSLGACERPAQEPRAPAARPEPVVVYASYDDENYLPSLLAEFTRETGIPVSVRHRPEHQIVSEVIEKRGSPPADVLLTRSVHGAWRAADEGALRPLRSETISGRVPAWLRDPDGYWTAIGFDTIEVVCKADSERDCDSIAAYEDLSEPEFKGRLCLSTSSLAVNRTLIAGLIENHGVRPAELIVRGWIANLALPPHETEKSLLQAVAKGSCALGVVSGLALRESGGRAGVATWPQPRYFDVVAVGINRHARSPGAARTLVEWLVGDQVQVAQFDAIGVLPVVPGVPAGEFPHPASESMSNANVFGLRAIEALKLAERVRWY